MRGPSVLLRHPNGLIAVDQRPVAEWLISYNPDDDRFYVHAPTEDGKHGGDVAKTFGTNHADHAKALNNARYWAKTNRYTAAATGDSADEGLAVQS